MEQSKDKDSKEIKYIGVTKTKYWRGEIKYLAKAKKISLGYYTNPREAARAYDLHVIRNNIDLETNFLKKKVAQLTIKA